MTEEQRYDVLGRSTGFELRRYSAHVIAEVEVEASFADAGNRAFGVLAGFISGRNSQRARVAMTAPVVQESAATRIAMTSPVLQEAGAEAGRYVIGFVMPAEFSLDTLPTPSDPRITVRQIPAQVAAARAFTGRWTERAYRQQLEELHRAVARAGLEIAGPPRFARFDPPWTPWFLRRNEVVLPLVGNTQAPGTPIRVANPAGRGGNL